MAGSPREACQKPVIQQGLARLQAGAVRLWCPRHGVPCCGQTAPKPRRRGCLAAKPTVPTWHDLRLQKINKKRAAELDEARAEAAGLSQRVAELGEQVLALQAQLAEANRWAVEKGGWRVGRKGTAGAALVGALYGSTELG